MAYATRHNYCVWDKSTAQVEHIQVRYYSQVHYRIAGSTLRAKISKVQPMIYTRFYFANGCWCGDRSRTAIARIHMRRTWHKRDQSNLPFSREGNSSSIFSIRWRVVSLPKEWKCSFFRTTRNTRTNTNIGDAVL